MNTRRRLCSGLTIMVMIGLLGCTPKPSDEQRAAKANEKILHLALGADIKGFDPVLVEDVYTSAALSMVYETLYGYAYLKRPYELEPSLAAAMPTVSKDGLTYTIKIRKGVLFTPDKAFATSPNQQRELVANDFIYSLKRIADTKTGANTWWLFEGRIKGLDEFRKTSATQTTVNYDVEVAGLQAPDRHTLKIILNEPYPQLLFALAMVPSSPIAREVVEHYGEDWMNHPVGTGAFQLSKWRRDLKLEFVRNPYFRKVYYPSEGTAEDRANGLLEAKGKLLPFVDGVVLHIYRESQPMWLNFDRGNLDVSGIPKDNYEKVITPNKKLADSMRKRGIKLWKSPSMDLTLTGFNMNDPFFGKHKKVRQAISLAMDMEKRVKLFYNGRALVAQSVIPPGVPSYDPKFRNPYAHYDLEASKKLLAEAGFPGGKGIPLLRYASVSSTTSRQMDEILKREMVAIGIKINIEYSNWNEFAAKLNKGQAQMWGYGWSTDYPDAINNLSLLYGPNKAPGPNASNFANPLFDKLYKQASVTQELAKRIALYRKMRDIAVEESPWVFGVHRIGFALQHGWLKNYKPHDMANGNARYYDIDLDMRRALKKAF